MPFGTYFLMGVVLDAPVVLLLGHLDAPLAVRCAIASGFGLLSGLCVLAAYWKGTEAGEKADRRTLLDVFAGFPNDVDADFEFGEDRP